MGFISANLDAIVPYDIAEAKSAIIDKKPIRSREKIVLCSLLL
jgi:hypothetical protein